MPWEDTQIHSVAPELPTAAPPTPPCSVGVEVAQFEKHRDLEDLGKFTWLSN